MTSLKLMQQTRNHRQKVIVLLKWWGGFDKWQVVHIEKYCINWCLSATDILLQIIVEILLLQHAIVDYTPSCSIYILFCKIGSILMVKSCLLGLGNWQASSACNPLSQILICGSKLHTMNMPCAQWYVYLWDKCKFSTSQAHWNLEWLSRSIYHSV